MADTSSCAWAAPDSAEDPKRLGVKVGDILLGKYRVDGILGVGGMGVVLEARHLKLDERVAIKLLLPAAKSDIDAVPRFEDEARATARIRSDHVARVTDLGVLEDGTPYMVMEHLEGEDLASWARRRAPVPVEAAIEIALQTCDVLVEAHALGIIHRDLKPANLFCVERPDQSLCVKVLDFGISKIRDSSRPASAVSATHPGVLMGSPIYMSPEQAQSAGSVDERTDIWALGIIVFELLTGNVPFAGETLAEVTYNITFQPLPQVRSFRPDAAPGIERVIARSLAKDRTDRYASVADLALALAPFGPRQPPAVISWAQSFRASGAAWRWVHISGLVASAFMALAIVAICVGRAASPSSNAVVETEMPVLSGPTAAAPGPCAALPPATVDPETLPIAGKAGRDEPKSEEANPETPGEEPDKTAPQRCTLNMNSIPVSNVVLDGTAIGRTPKIGFLTSAGTHTVMFEHPELGNLVTSVTCKAGEPKLVAVRLSRALAAAAGDRN